MQNFTQELLKKMACPITKGALIFDEATQELISLEAKKAYPIKEGIPCFILSQSRDLATQEIQKYQAK